jgi:predicted hotdog family 3-hydroxylacyl-ACP dehydratase
MTLDRDSIRSLIPHQGAMSLIDAVEQWDAGHIVCMSEQHREASNPLRVDGQLSCVNGIEFAGQAMAVHGALVGSAANTPRMGLLLSVRQCVFHCERLDGIASPLSIEAQKIAASEEALTYRFAIRAAGVLLLEGRISVMLRDGGD